MIAPLKACVPVATTFRGTPMGSRRRYLRGLQAGTHLYVNYRCSLQMTARGYSSLANERRPVGSLCFLSMFSIPYHVTYISNHWLLCKHNRARLSNLWVPTGGMTTSSSTEGMGCLKHSRWLLLIPEQTHTRHSSEPALYARWVPGCTQDWITYTYNI